MLITHQTFINQKLDRDPFTDSAPMVQYNNYLDAGREKFPLPLSQLYRWHLVAGVVMPPSTGRTKRLVPPY